MCLEDRRVMWCDDSSSMGALTGAENAWCGKTRCAMMFSSGRDWSFLYVVLDVAVEQPLASSRPHEDGGHEARVPVIGETHTISSCSNGEKWLRIKKTKTYRAKSFPLDLTMRPQSAFCEPVMEIGCGWASKLRANWRIEVYRVRRATLWAADMIVVVAMIVMMVSS